MPPYLVVIALQILGICQSAGTHSAQPELPSLHLQTRAEAVAKTYTGRLLVGGRRADEPEDAEKVYPWFVVLWLTGVDTLRSNN